MSAAWERRLVAGLAALAIVLSLALAAAHASRRPEIRIEAPSSGPA